MEKTPITKLSEAAESGIITNSPALWEEWKKTMEEAFRIAIIEAHKDGQSLVSCKPEYADQYYNDVFGKLKQ